MRSDKEMLIQWLDSIMTAEIEKDPDEADMELIDLCETCLNRLEEPTAHSEEALTRNLEAIRAKANKTKTARRPRFSRMVAAILAAVLVLGFTVSAYAFFPSVQSFMKDFLHLPCGSCVEEKNVSFMNCGELVEYTSIEELVQNEKLDIMYPHDLPEDLKIKSVLYTDETTDFVYSIIFDNSATILVKPGSIMENTILDCSENFSNKYDLEFYLKENDSALTAVTAKNGWLYYITTQTREDLNTIIENFY